MRNIGKIGYNGILDIDKGGPVRNRSRLSKYIALASLSLLPMAGCGRSAEQVEDDMNKNPPAADVSPINEVRYSRAELDIFMQDTLEKRDNKPSVYERFMHGRAEGKIVYVPIKDRIEIVQNGSYALGAIQMDNGHPLSFEPYMSNFKPFEYGAPLNPVSVGDGVDKALKNWLQK